MVNNVAIKNDLTKVNKPPASLNLSSNTNPARRQPPASLAGNANNAANTSMDLSMIMNKLNQSPAPSSLRKKPTGPSNYLKGKNGKEKENCTIF